MEPADAESRQRVLASELLDDLHEQSTRLFVPVSPADPMIIGTPRRRAASNMCSRSCVCHASGLDETSAPRGPGPMSQEPELAQIRSGSDATPISKLPVLIGAKPRCPLGHTIRSVRLAER